MRDTVGIALVLLGTATLTFRASLHEVADHGHKWLYGRRVTNRRRRIISRALEASAIALALLGVVVLAGGHL